MRNGFMDYVRGVWALIRALITGEPVGENREDD